MKKLLILITLLFACPVLAQFNFHPDPLPGWTHTENLAQDTANKQGLKVDGREFINSSPVIAEIDGDTSNGKEVAIGGSDGVLYVFASNGTLLWSRILQSKGCGAASKKDKLSSSPAIGDLFGDGVPYVVIGYGSVKKKSCKGGVVAYRGSDGTKLWDLELKQLAKKRDFFAVTHAVFGSPALADVDGDGQMEIGFGSLDRNVYLLEADGTIRFIYHAADTVFSSPVFYNVDSDSDLEMIFGTDITENKNFKKPTKNGGFLYAFKTDKRSGDFHDFRDKSRLVWKRYFRQVIHSSPVIADVLESNSGDEIVVQSGCFFPENTRRKLGKWIKVLNPNTGKVLRTIKTGSCASSSVAVADVNEDGQLEIVATVNGGQKFGAPRTSKLAAWNINLSKKPIWQVVPKVAGGNDKFIGTFRAPVVADIDGNGSLEVLITSLNGLAVYNGKTGDPLLCTKKGCLLGVDSPALTFYTSKQVVATPAIGDVNDDGVLDIVIGGKHGGLKKTGFIYAWTNLAGVLGSSTGTFPAYFAPWPQHRKDKANMAIY